MYSDAEHEFWNRMFLMDQGKEHLADNAQAVWDMVQFLRRQTPDLSEASARKIAKGLLELGTTAEDLRKALAYCGPSSLP